MDDLFAPLAQDYESWYGTPLGGFVIAEEERELLRALPDPPGHVLEVGAGTGWWTRILVQRGFRVTAVEPSDAMRHLGMPGTPSAEWLAASAESLPFESGTFDVVLLMTVLEFVSDRQRAIAEAWRVVRPGGSLVVGHLDPLSPWVALYRRLADEGMAPWAGARFATAAEVEAWVDHPIDRRASCVFLAPDAQPSFAEADGAGRRAGNAGALSVLRWRRSP